MEEWRPIPDAPGYEASSLGQIRSVDRVVEHLGRWGKVRRSRYRGRILALSQSKGTSGIAYLVFSAGRDGGRMLVNRAVCAAFHGPPPTPDHQAAHLDGNQLSNLPDNLAWSTPLENSHHKKIHGTMARGERFCSAKVAESDLPMIFTRYLAGESAEEIASGFGMHRRTLRKILGRVTWTHVPVPAAQVQAVAAEMQRRRLSNLRGGAG